MSPLPAPAPRLNLPLLLGFWAIVAALLIARAVTSADRIPLLADTDDAMRLAIVKDFLGGQGWYDHFQHRPNTPFGAEMHWSRLVDLPIAALILLLKPLVGIAWAERWACAIAPLLPFALAMTMMGITVRRLIAPQAWPVALIILFGCTSTILMFMPMRIDHHGWQLAMLSVTVAGLSDPRRARGGAIVGVSSAVSLTIGLEMLVYCASAGAILALRWIWDRDEAPRLSAYALALGGGSALGFALFASHANQAMRCDALTPVWLSVMVAAGALLFLLARFGPANRWLRLALAGAAGAAIVAGFVLLFPQCLARPEGVSEELANTWLNNVREAKPIYRHALRTAFPIAVLPVIGVIGALLSLWLNRGTERAMGWATIALFTLFAGLLLLWQIRAGPAAQMLSVPGATALVWIAVPWCLGHRAWAVRVLGSVAAFLLLSGLFAGFVIKYLPIDKPSERSRTVGRAGSRCMSLSAMRMLDRLPATTLFTHVDLGPRLIVTTHHRAIAGPYHRNGDAILDVHHAFQGSEAQFLRIARRHGATHLLTCPNMAETTVYRARARDGFYGHLARGEFPAWLDPVALPANAPYRLWRIDYQAGGAPRVVGQAGGAPPRAKLARSPSITN